MRASHFVPGNGEQPGPKRVVRMGGIESSQRSHRLQECLTGDIFGKVPIVQADVAEAKHPIPVAVEEEIEVGGFTLGGGDQGRIGAISVLIIVRSAF